MTAEDAETSEKDAMSIILELTPQEEAALRSEATNAQLTLTELARRKTNLPEPSTLVNGTHERVSLRDTAEMLARDAVEAEPGLRRIYLFPHESQIRLLYVDPLSPPVRPGDVIAPFYFGISKETGIPYRSAVGLVTPEEERALPPPEGWGEWEGAEILWEAK